MAAGSVHAVLAQVALERAAEQCSDVGGSPCRRRRGSPACPRRGRGRTRRRRMPGRRRLPRSTVAVPRNEGWVSAPVGRQHPWGCLFPPLPCGPPPSCPRRALHAEFALQRRLCGSPLHDMSSANTCEKRSKHACQRQTLIRKRVARLRATAVHVRRHLRTSSSDATLAAVDARCCRIASGHCVFRPLVWSLPPRVGADAEALTRARTLRGCRRECRDRRRVDAKAVGGLVVD